MTITTNNNQKWNDMPVKDKAAIITAVLSFCLGWVLIFLGFCVPPLGEINGSVLTAFGTALLYSAGAFGIVMYVRNNNANIYEQIEKSIEHKLQSSSSH